MERVRERERGSLLLCRGREGEDLALCGERERERARTWIILGCVVLSKITGIICLLALSFGDGSVSEQIDF